MSSDFKDLVHYFYLTTHEVSEPDEKSFLKVVSKVLTEWSLGITAQLWGN